MGRIFKSAAAMVFCASLLAESLSAVNAANLSSAVVGTVIVAKARGNALLLWDCTQELTNLVTQKSTPDQMLRTIEMDAVRAMAQKRKTVSKTATRLGIRVIYERVGAINPAYGTPTLQGVERLMTLEAPIGSIARHASFWIDQIAAGRSPAGLSVKVEGKVPGQ